MSILVKTDWNHEWELALGGPRQPDTPEFWNDKAIRCRRQGHSLLDRYDPYIADFIDYAALRPSESVLDIGCGPGLMSVLLAQRGHQVTALDFSHRMLAMLFQRAHRAGGLDVTPVLADWRDDWESKGVEKVDVALASRSVAAVELESAIRKLDAWARRRVCISTAAGGSPAFDRVLAKELGRHICQHSNFAYCMNILFAMDVRPELRFIDSPKHEFWSSRRHAEAAIRRGAGPLSSDEESRLQGYLRRHLVQLRDEHGRLVWQRDYTRVVEWAFIAWDKEQE
jgi:SAM-dependent methyltransferase